MGSKVVIAGGTGFIGTYLEKKLAALGYEVQFISRKDQHISWTNPTEIADALENAELLINLAGKSVDCRYTKKNREEILGSRVSTTQVLGDALLVCKNPPPLWINSSTATIYRHAEDRPMTEEDGEIGTGFSVNVAKEWENAFFSYNLPATRQIALRIAIVLGEGGGVMNPFMNMARFGLGGAQGSGSQMFSWIHIEDLYRIMMFLNEKKELSGVFNCSSPHPVSNKEFMEQLRKTMGVGLGLPSPKWLLEFGAVFLGTEVELVLKSRWVLPQRLLNEGFLFNYGKIEQALQQIMKTKA